MIEKVQKVLPNNEILRDVIALVNEGQRVTLPVKGYSMLPFIIGWLESVELVKPQQIAKGDVVLAWINGNRYVIHRIIKIDGDRVQLMGDGNLSGDEFCNKADVKAKAEYVIGSDGSRHYLYTRWRTIGSQIWWALKPLRRIILGVYRRTWLKSKMK